MASAPSDFGPVKGLVDHDGRLVSADAPLLRLQQEAGADLGSPIALPQLAAVVRTAQKLGVPLSRSVIAASDSEDIDLWVRAQPDEDGVHLTIESWIARPAAGPRLKLVTGGRIAEEEAAIEERRVPAIETDAALNIVQADPAVARNLGGVSVAGQPLTRHFQLVESVDGSLPLIVALGTNDDFAQQSFRLRSGSGATGEMSGTLVRKAGGGFGGYTIKIRFDDDGELPEMPDGQEDPVLEAALRSPLDQIIAAADRIVERSDGPLRTEYASYAGDIAAAGRHLLSVIQSMGEEIASNGDVVDLAKLAKEAVGLTEPDAQAAGVLIQRRSGQGPLEARGEERSILQILVNFLSNAIRHSPEGGIVSVSAGTTGGFVHVTVSDRGPGIAAEDHERIFERYEQGEGGGSAGLGLAIARRLARAMGGEIELDSAPGQGARFTLRLPAA